MGRHSHRHLASQPPGAAAAPPQPPPQQPTEVGNGNHREWLEADGHAVAFNNFTFTVTSKATRKGNLLTTAAECVP